MIIIPEGRLIFFLLLIILLGDSIFASSIDNHNCCNCTCNCNCNCSGYGNRNKGNVNNTIQSNSRKYYYNGYEEDTSNCNTYNTNYQYIAYDYGVEDPASGPMGAG